MTVFVELVMVPIIVESTVRLDTFKVFVEGLYVKFPSTNCGKFPVKLLTKVG